MECCSECGVLPEGVVHLNLSTRRSTKISKNALHFIPDRTKHNTIFDIVALWVAVCFN